LEDENHLNEDLEPFEAEAKDIKTFEDHGQVFEKSDKDVFSIRINDRYKQAGKGWDLPVAYLIHWVSFAHLY
jgi:outer membrane biogenesis lipoprotein LolB